ncbi:MAG: hypothetical protein ABIR24_06100 [Verrucomicrobiota bacterium]
MEKLNVVDKKAWTSCFALVTNIEIIMSLLLCVRKQRILSALILAFPLLVLGQPINAPQGNEHALVGSLVGDQVYPGISLNQNGGYLVWEENGSIKSGTEIKAARLTSSFTTVSNFAVNKVAKGDQKNPQVQLLNNGEAIFVWQSYGLGNANIYARILKDDAFTTGDILVNAAPKSKNSYFKDQQSDPVVCALQDGSALVAWQSLGQDGSLRGVYFRKVSSSGKMESDEVLANQTTAFNQRNPAVATLADGNVIVVWISEQQRFDGSVDVYARLFTANGSAVSGERLLNSANNLCANPSVAALSGGGFTVVWSEKDLSNQSNSWEIVGRSFSADAVAAGGDFKINTHTYGDQYRPKIAAVGNDCAVVWTSLGQDGSREGVYGRILQGGAQPSGNEFRVNTTTVSRQRYPNVASDGTGRFLVGWSGFVAVTSFDLFGQEYILSPQP